VTNAPPKPRITTEGHVYVSIAAAEQYARAMSMDPVRELEEARRDLTELMLDAYRTETGTVRMRNNKRGLDISARVAKEGRLLVIVSVETRDRNFGSARR